MNKNEKKKNDFWKNFPLNGNLLLGTLFIVYLLLPTSIKNNILHSDGECLIYGIIGILAVAIFITLLENKYNTFDNVLKFAYSIIYTFIFSYFTLFFLVVIAVRSGISLSFNKVCFFSINAILCLIFFSTVFWRKNKLLYFWKISTAIFEFFLILLFSFSISIHLYEISKWIPIYLYGTIVIVLAIILVLWYLYHKKIIKVEDIISVNLFDGIMVFLFYIFALLIIAAYAIIEVPAIKVINDWVPILAISIACVLYYLGYKKVLKNSSIYNALILALIITIGLFAVSIQRQFFGNYSTLKIFLGLILFVDAIIILSFNKEMDTILPEFERKYNLTERRYSKLIVSKIKIMFTNITIIVTLVNTVLSDKNKVEAVINDVSSF